MRNQTVASIKTQTAYGSYIHHDVAFMTSLVLTVVLGILTRQIKNDKKRENTMAAIGVIYLLLYTGFESLHIFWHIGGALLLVKYANGTRHPRILFVYSFIYRILFYCSHAFIGHGLPNVEYTITNAIHLTLVIKTITFAYEIRDYQKFVQKGGIMKERMNRELGKPWPLQREPTMREIVCYFMNFSGLMAGPLITFRTYHDSIHSGVVKYPYKRMVMKKLLEAIVYLTIWVALKDVFSVDYMRSNEFYNSGHSLLYKFNYAFTNVFVVFASFSAVWTLAEAGCIACGIGVYPKYLEPKSGQGPSVLYTHQQLDVQINCEDELSSETVKNISPVEAFLGPYSRIFFRKWNSCVQWWLGNFVYHADVFVSFPRTSRAYMVMLVSAVWHGYQPGYYVSFLSVPLLFFAEDALLRTIRDRLKNGWQQKVYIVLHWWCFKMWGVGYMMSAFKLRTFDAVLRYYSNTYCLMHVICVVIIIICSVFNVIVPQQTHHLKNGNMKIQSH